MYQWIVISIIVFLSSNSFGEPKPKITVKVMIVSMFGPEGEVWRSHRVLDRLTVVPGLLPADSAVHCGRDGVCQVTTGMGYANAAASISALIYSRQFDLQKTYWLIAGVAGINPARGTLGTAAWAHYLVDFGLQWELDKRDAPAAWPSGYLGINTMSPAEKPQLIYGTEVFKLNDELVNRAFSLSESVKLTDSPSAQKARAVYGYAPANAAPAVVQCDTLSSDTWFSGTHLTERADVWASELTDHHAVACTSQQEDNATFAVLMRAAGEHLVDTNRVAVLRTGSDFDRAPPGGSDASTLLNYQSAGGFEPAVMNLYLAGNTLVQEIAGHWSAWRRGVPPR